MKFCGKDRNFLTTQLKKMIKKTIIDEELVNAENN